MNIEQWFYLVTSEFQKKGIQISPETENFLLSELPVTLTPNQTKIINQTIDLMIIVFFEKVTRGETFGLLSRIKEKYGKTVEEHYGLSTGPFINMARTYWTFKLEINDLFPDFTNIVLSKILRTIEEDMASLFFPTPGPATIPVKKRREAQRKFLEIYAPEIDIDRFLSENPLLKIDKFRETKIDKIPEEIQSYCYKCIFKLATEFNKVLSAGYEYINGFEMVMDSLSVPKQEREKILKAAIENAESSGIDYYNLSPVNQYLVTVLPYVYYCLQTNPPLSLTTFEIKRFLDNEEFSQYIHKLGIEVSQKVKGALWRPGGDWLRTALSIIIICTLLLLAILLF